MTTLTVPITITTDNAVSRGMGGSTVYQRGADMTTNHGMVDVTASGVVIGDMTLDGDVTTAVGVDIGTLSDPVDATLIKNTMIWVHGGVSNLLIENVTITHQSGYGIFLDARAGDIDGVIIRNCTFINNRPFLFGPTSDYNYGSWVGPIFYANKSDGSNTYTVKNVIIQNCTFKRNTGNCIWGHSYGFEAPNSNITIQGCVFEDCGLDAIEVGNAYNVSVSGCTFHRLGWIATDDTSATTPAYQAGRGALGIDCTSGVFASSFTNNTMTSTTGGFFDLDGMWDSVITGNSCVQPKSGDALYTPDSIATAGISGGTQRAYGIQTGNTFARLGGSNITISDNTFINCGSRAISLSNAKNCIITDNKIWHSGSASENPITIICTEGYDNGVLTDGNGSIGTTADKDLYRSHGNLIMGNRITYGEDSSASNFCILEKDAAGQTFAASDVNQVFNNRITGTNYGEFNKNTNSSSYTGVQFSSNDASATSGDITRIQREGHSTSAALKIYRIVSGTATQVLGLSDAAFLNISTNGTANTGVLATGNRTSSSVPDIVATGKSFVDGFVVIGDAT